MMLPFMHFVSTYDRSNQYAEDMKRTNSVRAMQQTEWSRSGIRATTGVDAVIVQAPDLDAVFAESP
jgi:hypothetical protein